MNKNTVIGFVLIGVILIGFSWYNTKTFKEQERARFVADSIAQVEALKNNDFERFLMLVKQSGYSSYMYLQNVIPAGYKAHQEVAIALALSEHYLNGRGAYRVHGGGFAGTIQAFVPYDMLDRFVEGMDAVLGKGACHVLSIRPQGGVKMEVR